MLHGYDLFAQTSIEIHALFGLSAPIHWNEDVREHVSKPISRREQTKILSGAFKPHEKDWLVNLSEWLFTDSPALAQDKDGTVKEVYFTDFSKQELEERLSMAA